jgi:SNF2 family DNA or RNA helicase
MDLWSEVYLLDRGQRLGKTLGVYRDTFFTPGRRNGHVVYDWRLRPFAKEEIDKKLEDLCISMKAEDWLTMPDRVDTEVYVTMAPDERKAYDQFGRDHILQAKEGDVVGLTAATVQNKLLQMANGFAYTDDGSVVHIHDRKLDALEEIIEAAHGRNILCFYSFIEDKDRILRRFKDIAETFDPRLTLDAWNEGKIKLLLAHPASAGHGLNLQAGGNIIVWYGLPWSLELYEQANARLHRQGQKSTVFVYHILTKGTHDEDVLDALRRKTVTQESLLASLKARIGGWKNA